MSGILSSKDLVTRKEQRCFGCTIAYPPGTAMLRQSVKDGKTVFTAYLCETCQEIIARTFRPGDDYSEGQLHDGDPEYWREVYTELRNEKYEKSLKQPAQA